VRRPASPVAIVGVFLVVIATIAVLFANDWGEFGAFVFALAWLGVFRKRRFAVGAAVCSCFAAMAIALAVGSPIANVFGDGVFGGAVVLLFTMRRRPAGDCLRVLILSGSAGADSDAGTFLSGLFSAADASERNVCFTLCTTSEGDVLSTYASSTYSKTDFFIRKARWLSRIGVGGTAADLASLGIAAADEQDVDVIYGVGGPSETFASILVGIATGIPVVCHVESDPHVARYEGAQKSFVRMLLSNARRVLGRTRDALDGIVAAGYPSARCEVLALSAPSFDRLVDVFQSERR
jgi:hypothetical protein